ncbi:ABC transporter substrate-binding protein [Chelativorans salis]|uniref:ABC transporter substrate-binding protein n=1 Tax=Chelativorans salis TaxID=2978478 RepID=A0ABT2LUP8_9HYPH|nr:ABC transporter substrate-binding protein [Chelativorans sp. EGI FJ00035]MCT7378255.1 ABC transporter substrate-binding protein [Chelativorans sp. EGI FJ00035]
MTGLLVVCYIKFHILSRHHNRSGGADMGEPGIARTVTRRHVLALSASAFATAGFGIHPFDVRAATGFEGLAEGAHAAGESQVVVAGGTGAYGELVREHFYVPFTAATGINVVTTGGSYGDKLAKLKAMASIGRVEWDVITLSADMLTPDVADLLFDLGDCAMLPDVGLRGVDGACLGHGVLFDVGGAVLAFDERSFPDNRRQPSNWVDFWDVETFPGPRALPNIGTPWWSLMAALQADGVGRDDLFPLDLDRAFAKLDEIKPHISVWWRSGDQSQQMFRTREVVMGMLFSGRAFRLRREGLPISVSWHGAIMDAALWALTQGAPHPNAGLALLDFIYTRPRAHAVFAEESFGSTAQREALNFLSEESHQASAVNPANWSQIVDVDRSWLAANRQAVLERWNLWLAS